MAARQPQFSPKQVAQAMQVSESSVKRWCDRGLIPTIRTVGGHRRITLDGLQHFLTATGRELPAPNVLGLPTLPVHRNVTLSGGGHPNQVAFREFLSRGDESGCREVMERHLESGWTRSEAIEDLVTDAMHGVGSAWESKVMDVYQERRAVGIVMRLIAELRAGLPQPSESAPIAIGGSPEGDPYQIPSAMVELALREVGWNATNLGADLPLTSFLQASHDYDPQLVWMSISTVQDPAPFVAAQNRLADELGEDVPLLIGGRALSDTVRPKLRYTAHCDSLRHLVELAAMMRLNHRLSDQP
ncbi:MAG: helix-turn-helix domain-containing protein [Planctomycetota bacterium]